MNIVENAQEGVSEFDTYMHGDCDIYALAVNELTGWPIVVEMDEDGDYQHALLKLPSGELFDYSGTRPFMNDDELRRYHGVEVSNVEVSPDWLMQHMPARQRIDLAARIEQAKAVFATRSGK